MAFPTFPSRAFINALGDADLVHIGQTGANSLDGILSVEPTLESDGEYSVYVEAITLEVLENDISLVKKGDTIKQGSSEFIITAIPPADMGMVEVVLERKVK